MRQAFKTARGQAEFYAAYDAAMQTWPVPHEVLDIPGAFGTTRVVLAFLERTSHGGLGVMATGSGEARV